MNNTRPSCDIFCTVVDNYGDAAVCWRLARQLANEHGWTVRLWIDDPVPLARLAPDYATGPVEVRIWPDPWPMGAVANDLADIVIEAFACDLPSTFVEAMALRSHPPVWLNLEYLSAESWVTGCHGLPSPHPRLPLIKFFYFPGFEPGTGGLLREHDYDARRNRFDEAAFRAEFGLPAKAPGEITISLFSYANPALPELIRAWTGSSRPIRVLRPGCIEKSSAAGNLSLHSLPFLPQQRYDELLWACNLNFVRGEDSFVRAQWAARPFVWQIYPQEQDAHLHKLEAFLAIHPAGEALRPFWLAWNGAGPMDWPRFSDALPALAEPMRQWSQTLAERRDLAAGLVQFCLQRLK